ncbi:proline racemase family protein [Pararobbsia silviterrae]|uniref:Proline racemase n=1 Tax=Pararobbsia silviterrae TaxID=1792498 RepID=A0A494Y6N1_9BURK|nr:proline racemase family protein [Pararobbsia silviterrae]RKP57732.1 proline racemase [Pararobbsia silviterrae]
MTQTLFPPSALDWLARSERQQCVAVDSHTAGNPTRIVLSGITLPPGVKTVDAARAWLRDHADHWRTRLVHEPRGGGLTCAVVPIETKEDGCDIGAVILEPGSYPPMCGHCMIGFGSVIVELDLLPNLWRDSETSTSFRVRTPAGPIGLTAHRENGRLLSVTLTNVESFVVGTTRGKVNGVDTSIDLLYGGDYYISVDAKAIGLSLDRDNATEIVHVARALRAEYTQGGVRDPLDGKSLDVYQVLFYERDPESAHRVKIVVVAPPGVIDRSPCGTGSSAMFAKLVTEGSVKPTDVVTTRSIIGSTFTVTAHAVRKGQRVFVTPDVTGSAYINGFLTIAADEHDALADGFAPL